MPSQILISHLAAHAGTRQVEAVLQADRAANAVDRSIGATWQSFLALLKQAKGQPHLLGIVREKSHRIFAGLVPSTKETLGRHFGNMALWGHRTARQNLIKTLPTSWLAAMVLRRAKSGSVLRPTSEHLGQLELSKVRGSVDYPPPWRHTRLLLEGDRPGIIQLALDALSNLYALDFASDLREPARDELSEDDAKALFARILFPPPSEQKVKSILDTVLGGTTWYQALDQNARAAEFGPDNVAATIAQHFAAGESQREIAKAVLPYVDGVRYRARRTARTFGLAILNASQDAAHEAIADITVGQQVHASLDQWTRTSSDPDKNHRMRNGTIYHVHPGAGQKGMDKAPNPPAEYDGELAWNCRCYISPVLSPPPGLTAKKMKVFTNAKNKAIPDPAVYAQWFAKASEKARRLAVGSKRYDAAKDAIGRNPHYHELVDHRTGDLLSVRSIRNETSAKRVERVAKVNALINHRKELLRQVATFGFVA